MRNARISLRRQPLYTTPLSVKSHAGFHGYDRAWFLSDITDFVKLGESIKDIDLISHLQLTKHSMGVFRNYFLQC